MNVRFVSAAALLIVSFVLSGCDQSHTKDDGHAHSPSEKNTPSEETEPHADPSMSAFYAEGKGLLLPEKTRQAIGLKTEPVAEREIRAEMNLTAQIYRSASEPASKLSHERANHAYATALVSREEADRLTVGQPLTFQRKEQLDQWQKGILWKIDFSSLSALGKVEVLLELPDDGRKLKVGDFVVVQIPLGKVPVKVIALPRSAILTTAEGMYAFVQNGEYLLRTPIQRGNTSREFVEVTDGLYEGDIVATEPVEALHLIELRATKGGGHCH